MDRRPEDDAEQTVVSRSQEVSTDSEQRVCASVFSASCARNEVESPSHVQDTVPRPELGRLAKHGGRGTRGWKTLHVGVDHTGVIVAHALTDATGDDAPTGVELIEAVNDAIASVTADAAYDTVGCYDAAGARGATVVVPPTKTARVSRRRPRSSARDHTLNTVKSLGRRRWKQTSRDHQQARVENACFRYKSIIGDGLRARTPGGRTVEAQLACNMLNAMTDMGRPASDAVGR